MGAESSDATAAASAESAVLHALVIKGFASVEALAHATGLPVPTVAAIVERSREHGLAELREGRISGWRPTPAGREAHGHLLEGPLAPTDADGLREAYERFSDVNTAFKELCGRWQLRGAVLNDHSDADYDRAVIGELAALDGRAGDLCDEMSVFAPGVARYRFRLADALAGLEAGDRDKFTKPLYESYHDVWMELHHDLITTLRLERTASDA